MELSFKLESFEGPLDLLLHLIDKNKVDIYDIPIALITEQYLEYVRSMDEKDADKMSEFLVMAATLLDIKAKMLLPKEVDEEGNEEDPRAELVQKLLEYKMYKYMSYELKDKEVSASHALYKGADIPDEVKKYEAPIDLDVMLSDTTLKKLQDIFNDVIARSIERTNLNALRMQSIKREQVSITDRVTHIRSYLNDHKEFSFRRLIEKQQTKINIIVTFLAILEMMKAGELNAEMTSDNEDIIISRREEGADDYDEEFEIPEDIKKKEHRREVRAANKAMREAKARELAEQQAAEGVAEQPDVTGEGVAEQPDMASESGAEPPVEAFGMTAATENEEKTADAYNVADADNTGDERGDE